MTHKMKRSNLLLCLTAGAAAFAAAQSVSAATATSTLGVSATIPSNCTVTTTAVAFGSYTGSLLNAQGAVNVTCTNTTGYTVALDQGNGTGGGAGATTAARLMTGSNGGTLTYSLYTDNTYGTVWGNAPGVTGTGNGSQQSLTVYGQIPASQTANPGTYNDTVNVTVTY